MRSSTLFFLLSLAAPLANIFAQTPTLRSAAKLVVVDVVVLDSHGSPVKGLKQDAFDLIEDKHPQSIRSFEEHDSATPTNDHVSITLPPGTFTNYTPVPVNSALNIILLDTLNTPMQDQSFVRRQLLEYLKTSRPGSRIAIFGLTTRLDMLQGFTTDHDLLQRAVLHTKPTGSPLLSDPGGSGAPEDLSDQLAGVLSGGLGTANPGLLYNIQNFEAEQKSFLITSRTTYTLDAFNQLARYLAGIPGRKNLIWFSGSFPLNIMPDADAKASPFAGEASSQTQFRETTNLLTRSQVAVYPVDALGIRPAAMFAESDSNTSRTGNGSANPASMLIDERANTEKIFDDHSTMNQMAEDTGGKAFFNTNGLAQATAQAIEVGSNYYTLSYVPTDTSWLGAYRSIRVKVSASGSKLYYRHGYYADDPNTSHGIKAGATADSAPPALKTASLFGAPPATQIIFKALVTPATGKPEPSPASSNTVPPKSKGPWMRYFVDFAADGHNIVFDTTPDSRRHATIQFVTVAYAMDGTLVNSVLNTIKADLSPEEYTAMLRGGMHIEQQISVPETGSYALRVIIHDNTSGLVGSLELPVRAVKNLTPISVQAEALRHKAAQSR